MKGSVWAIVLAGTLVFVALFPAIAVLADGERAAGSANAPRWAVNDRWAWKMDKTVRYVNTYSDINGTLTIVYREDDAFIQDKVAALEGQKYRIDFTELEWLNGSYNFKPSPAGVANGWLESNGTMAAFLVKAGVRYRTTADLSLVNATIKMAYRYGSQRTDGNYRVFNWSGNETHSLATDAPLNSLRFPLSPGDGWSVDTNLTDVYQGVKEWPDYPGWGTSAYSGNRYDHYRYSVSAAAATETRTVNAGTFECLPLSDSGTDDWGWAEGGYSGWGSAAYLQTRWYSRIAGTTVDTNGTTRLESFSHLANLPPRLDPIPAQMVNEDDTLNLELAPYALDPDVANQTGDYLTYSATCSPPIPGLEVNGTTGVLSVTPTQEQLGAHTVSLTVEDTYGAKATRSFSLNVANTNDPPYLTGRMANVTIYENIALRTDIFLDRVFADPDPPQYDHLEYTPTGNESVEIAIDAETRVSLASPDLYAPPSPLVITFTATDTGSGNASAVQNVSTTLNVTIVHRNHAPAAGAIPNITMQEDDYDASLDLADYFSDVDIAYAGDSLRYGWSGNSKVGVNLMGSEVTFNPALDWNGMETITFTATDSGDLNASTAVNVQVRPVNDLPRIQATGTTPETSVIDIPEASGGTFSEIRFFANATDADRDTLVVTWTVTNCTGRKVGEGRGNPYIFKTAYLGALSSEGSLFTVTVSVSDGTGNASMNWTVNVTNVNRKPVAVIASPQNGARYEEKSPVLLNASGSRDDDQDPGTLTYLWNSSLEGNLGTGANLTVSNLRKGAHTITLTVTDAENESSTATVIVTVTAPPAPAGKGFLPGFEATFALACLGALFMARMTRRRP